MNPSDNSLKNLLRQVDAPPDLKSQLLKIPQPADAKLPIDSVTQLEEAQASPATSFNVKPNSRRFSKTRHWIGWFAAASLFGILLFAIQSSSPFTTSTKKQTRPEAGAPNIEPDNQKSARQTLEHENTVPDSASVVSESPESQLLMTRIDNYSEQIESLQTQMAISRLKHRLNEVRNDQIASAPPTRIDTASIIACYTSQAKKEWGIDDGSIDLELKSVVERFPNSAGAKYAIRLLSTPTQ